VRSQATPVQRCRAHIVVVIKARKPALYLLPGVISLATSVTLYSTLRRYHTRHISLPCLMCTYPKVASLPIVGPPFSPPEHSAMGRCSPFLQWGSHTCNKNQNTQDATIATPYLPLIKLHESGW